MKENVMLTIESVPDGGFKLRVIGEGFGKLVGRSMFCVIWGKDAIKNDFLFSVGHELIAPDGNFEFLKYITDGSLNEDQSAFTGEDEIFATAYVEFEDEVSKFESDVVTGDFK